MIESGEGGSLRKQGRSGVHLSFEGCLPGLRGAERRGKKRKGARGAHIGWGGVMPAWDLACSGLALSMIITEGSRSQEGEKGGVGVDTVNHGRREGASTGKEGRAESLQVWH